MKLNAPAILALEMFLYEAFKHYTSTNDLKKYLSIINTDNVNENGSKIMSYIIAAAIDRNREDSYRTWLQTNVIGHITMVSADRSEVSFYL